jgi:hypothetical protein
MPGVNIEIADLRAWRVRRSNVASVQGFIRAEKDVGRASVDLCRVPPEHPERPTGSLSLEPYQSRSCLCTTEVLCLVSSRLKVH